VSQKYNLTSDTSHTPRYVIKIYYKGEKTPNMSQSAWSLGEGVETFQIGSYQIMFHPNFIQARTGESV